MKPVMVIDRGKCVGCRACVAACAIENGLMFPAAKPAGEGRPATVHLRTWVSWAQEEGSTPARQFLRSACMHCQDAPCVTVCPTGASYRTDEGVVLIDKAKCIGCGYCLVACPYGARYHPDPEEDRRIRAEPVVAAAHRGTAYGAAMFKPPVQNPYAYTADAIDKCTFCYHRKDATGRWVPACAETCPTDAIRFGDLDDAADPVTELVRGGRARPVRPELGTDPRVYYVE